MGIVKRAVGIIPWSILLRMIPSGRVANLQEQAQSRLMRLLWRFLWAVGFHGKVRSKVLKKVHYQLDRKKLFTMQLNMGKVPECAYYVQNPTPQLTELILKKGKVFLDIGSNAGFHALCAASSFETVYAFEPTPDTFERLQNNINLNGFQNVHAARLALSSEAGYAKFYVSDGHCGGNTMLASHNGEQRQAIEVEMTTLDDFVASKGIEGIDLIKIDVEGFEAEVLKGARKTIEQHRPILFIEIFGSAAARKVLDALPRTYRIWNPETKAEMTILEYMDESRSRDVVFAIHSPYRS